MFSKIIQFFKRYWVFVFLAAIAGGLIVLRLSRKPAPEIKLPPISQPTINQPKITGISISQNTRFALADFSFPSQLKIYQGQENILSPDKAIKIAQEFNFSQSPQISEDVSLGRFYTWASETHSLSIALDANRIGYGLDFYQVQPSTQRALPSPETAKTTLENLLVKLELTPQFETKWQKEEYLIREYYFQPATSPEEAGFIRAGFNPAVDNYQLVGLNPNEPLVFLILSKGEEIIYFQYQIYFSDFVESRTYSLKTKEEVQNSLVTEGKIVYAGTFRKTTKEPEFTRMEFNQIQLAYFQELEKTSTIQPIFILSGQGTLVDGGTTEIIAYLPAISSKWLRPAQEHFRP